MTNCFCSSVCKAPAPTMRHEASAGADSESWAFPVGCSAPPTPTGVVQQQILLSAFSLFTPEIYGHIICKGHMLSATGCLTSDLRGKPQVPDMPCGVDPSCLHCEPQFLPWHMFLSWFASMYAPRLLAVHANLQASSLLQKLAWWPRVKIHLSDACSAATGAKSI